MGSELACVYAALILHDDEIEISAENINKILDASGVKVEAYWPTLFAKLCKGKDINSMISSVGSGGGGGGGGAAPAAAAGGAAAAPAAKEKEPEPEEEEEDMGFDLFD